MRNIEEMLKGLLIENTQKDLADKLGTSTKSIQNWLSGSFKPEREMVKTIRDLYKVEQPLIEVTDNESKIAETLIRVEALVLAQGAYLSEIYAKLFEVPSTKALKDLEQMGKAEARRLRDELK